MAKALTKKQKQTRFKRFAGLIIAMAALAMLLMFQSPRQETIGWVNKPKKAHFGFGDKTVSREVPLCRSMIVENWSDYHHCTIVQFDIFAKANESSEEQLRLKVKSHHSQIKDMVRSTVASIHPSEIRDPGLMVVKNHINQRMEQIIGPQMVDKILVPNWNAYIAYQ